MSVAAVSAVTAAMAVSAMAADTITGTYDKETGKVTIENVTSTGTSQTLLVLKNDAATVAAEDIAQIDQRDDNASFTEFVLPAGIETGTYYIRVGGDGNIQTGTLTISNGQGGDDKKTIEIVIGDVDGSEDVDGDDVTALARAVVGLTGAAYDNETVGTEYTAVDSSKVVIGDVDGSEDVDGDDVTALARAVAELTGAAYDNESVGTTVTVYAE